MPYTYEYFQKSADFLKEKVDFTPEIAIILGSCLGPFAQEIENPVVVDYKDSLAQKYSVSTVNGAVAAMNGFFDFIGRPELRVKPLKKQKNI